MPANNLKNIDSFNHSSVNDANGSPNTNNKNKDNDNDVEKNYLILNNLSNGEKVKEMSVDSDLTANPEFRLSANDVINYMDNEELSEHFERKRNMINQTFLDYS